MFKKESALVPLGGLPWFDEQTRIWQTSAPGDPGDLNGITHDRLRVIATSLAYGHDPQWVVAVGDPPGTKSGMPSGCEVVVGELKELGVRTDHIARIENKKTHWQLLSLCALMGGTGISQVIIITNEWHCPRVREIISNWGKLKSLRACAEVSPAEVIMLAHRNHAHVQMVEAARNDPRMLDRIALEKRGVEMIRAGTYQFT